jgi:tRNA A-37 threonylcarbamoyl transferase component Bud32
MPEPASEVRVIGRYAMRAQIAAGGMATVHLGKLLGPVGFSRVVAIKALHAQFAKDPDFLAMFLDEARLAGRIRHPNVVSTFDVVVRDGELFLIMDYVPGEALGRLIRMANAAGRSVPLPIALSVLHGALEGLHAAHEASDPQGHALGIVHRDVSPQNMLVGVDGVTRILDFGVAKAVGRMQVTRGDQLKGKIAYMAPEQLSRQRVDRGVDIYAASIVLWELVTGQRLFQADDEVSTLQLALAGNIPRARELRPEIPMAVEEIIAQGLARRRDDRFASAQDMARALERTGLLAPAREVSAWVKELAHAELAARAHLLWELETNSAGTAERELDAEQSARDASFLRKIDGRLLADAATEVTALPVSEAGAMPRARRGWLLWGLALLGVAAIALLARSAARADLSPPSEPPVVTTAAARALAPSVAVEPALAAATLPQRISAEQAAKKPLPAPRRARLGSASAKPRSACDEPFTIDAQGVRIPKRECL